jgi:hypothetical protein
MHRFPRDASYRERLDSASIDPFDARICEFPVPAAYTISEVKALIEQLVVSCDSLRTAIRRDRDGTISADWFTGSPSLHIIDLDATGAEAVTPTEFLAANRGAIHLLDGPVAAFWYLRSARINRGVLRLISSHFALDLGSRRVFARTVADLVAGRAETYGRPGGYFDWMDAYFAYANSDLGRREHQWWVESAERPIVATRKALTARRGLSVTSTLLEVPESVLNSLRDRCRRHWNCRAADAVIASIGMTLASEFSLSSIPFMWTTHGRHPQRGHHFSRTSGWLSNLHPLILPLPSSGLQDAIRCFRDGIAKIPNSGASFAWVRRFSPLDRTSVGAETLIAPFRVNLRESVFRPSESNGARAGREVDPKIVTQTLPSRCQGDLHLRMTIELGRTLRVTVKSVCEDSRDTGLRITQSIATEIYRYAFSG